MDPPKASCPVCQRPPSVHLDFLCCTCARSMIYTTRVQSIQALLEKEQLSDQVSRILKVAVEPHTDSATSMPSGALDTTDLASGSARATRVLQLQADSARSEELRRSYTAASAEIRRDIKALRANIGARRDEVSRRKARLAGSQRALGSQAPAAVHVRGESAVALEADWRQLHGAIADDRVLLCHEAASLYGLEARRRRQEGGSGGGGGGGGGPSKEVYMLGGVPLVDLQDMNSTFRITYRYAAQLRHAPQMRRLPWCPWGLRASLTCSTWPHTTWGCSYRRRSSCRAPTCLSL